MKSLTKKIVLLMAASAFVITGCKKETESTIDLSNVEILPCSITADRVLTDKGAGVDYLVTCEMEVTNGTLTINPGVTIAFETDAGITVTNNGALKVVGTSVNPVLLTGVNKAKGAWQGIFFQSNSVLNQLTYAVVEYAGGVEQSDMDEKTAVGIGATDINTNTVSQAVISYTTIKESAGYGLSIDYNTTIKGFSTNKLINNALAGLKLPMGYLGYLDAASDYLTGNLDDFIFVRIGAQGDFVKTNQTWKLLNAPYHFEKGTQSVYAGTILADVTIEAGATLLFNTNTGLMVGEGSTGSLKAIGTSAKPITFKGVSAGNGSWVGLSYTTTSTNNILEQCIIDGGGASSPTYNDSDEKGNIVVGSLYGNAKLSINAGTIIRNSAAWGIFLTNATFLTLNATPTYLNNTSGTKNL